MIEDNLNSKHSIDLTSKGPVSIGVNEIWNVISGQAKDVLGEEIFERWFEDLIPLGIDGDRLQLQAKNQFDALWLHNNYQDVMDALLGLQNDGLTCYFKGPKGN